MWRPRTVPNSCRRCKYQSTSWGAQPRRTSCTGEKKRRIENKGRKRNATCHHKPDASGPTRKTGVALGCSSRRIMEIASGFGDGGATKAANFGSEAILVPPSANTMPSTSAPSRSPRTDSANAFSELRPALALSVLCDETHQDEVRWLRTGDDCLQFQWHAQEMPKLLLAFHAEETPKRRNVKPAHRLRAARRRAEEGRHCVPKHGGAASTRK